MLESLAALGVTSGNGYEVNVEPNNLELTVTIDPHVIYPYS